MFQTIIAGSVNISISDKRLSNALGKMEEKLNLETSDMDEMKSEIHLNVLYNWISINLSSPNLFCLVPPLHLLAVISKFPSPQ